jgi:hypothetical protein
VDNQSSGSIGKREASSPFADSIAIVILRIIFVVAAAGLGASLAASMSAKIVPGEERSTAITPYLVFSGVLLVACGVIFLDLFIPRKRIEVISAIYFGLLVGESFTFSQSINYIFIIL